MAHNPNLENDVNKLHPLLERKSLSCSQLMPLRLFYSLSFDLVAVLHATMFLAKVDFSPSHISFSYMYIFKSESRSLISFHFFSTGSSAVASGAKALSILCTWRNHPRLLSMRVSAMNSKLARHQQTASVQLGTS